MNERATGGAGLRAALRERDFRTYLAGQALSQLGTKMQNAALLWHLYTLTRSPLALGAFGVARLAPLVLFGLWGGVVADRVDRRRLMLATAGLLAAIALGLALTTHLGLGGPVPLYAGAALFGLVSAFDAPARQSLLPSLVPARLLTPAIGLDSLAQKLAKVLGPVLMAALVVTHGPEAVYLANAASYGAVAVALLGLRSAAPPTSFAKGGLEEVLGGIRHLRASPVLGPLLAMDVAASFFGSADTMLPILVAEVFGLDAPGYALVAAAGPAGAFAGSLAAARFGHGPDLARRATRATVGYGAAVVVLGLSRSLPLTLAALVLAAFSDTVATVLRHTVRQATTPDALRGRVAAASALATKSGPWLGEVEAGLAAGLLGVGPSIALGGVACLLATLVLSSRLRPAPAAP